MFCFDILLFIFFCFGILFRFKILIYKIFLKKSEVRVIIVVNEKIVFGLIDVIIFWGI